MKKNEHLDLYKQMVMIRRVEERGAELVGFSYTSTLLGLTLTQKKLNAAEEFARNISRRLNP